jgi:hypothetical protein
MDINMTLNSNSTDDLLPEFNAQSQYKELFEGHQKKIDCPYELVFNITGHMMKQDEDGRDMQCDQVCNKNYHIPVKEGADPKTFMDTFFNFLEGCLSQSAKHAYTNNE